MSKVIDRGNRPVGHPTWCSCQACWEATRPEPAATPAPPTEPPPAVSPPAAPPPATPRHPGEWGSPKPPTGRKTSRGALAAGVVVVIAVLVGIAAMGGNRSSTGSGSGGPSMAFEMCKTFVKRQLKAPSTATFRNYYENDGEVRVSGSGDGPYTVVSTVDAENSFGAKIRNSFVCTVTYQGNDQWHLDDLSLN